MKNQIKVIYAACSENAGEVFDVDRETSYCSQDDCIRWKCIQLYGSMRELTDDEYEAVSDGDLSLFEKIGSILGCLILGRQIVADGELINDICDDVNGDLQYVTSALEDLGEPLDVDPVQDIFYIHEFSMDERFPDLPLKARILNELPRLCLRLFHIKPDLLAFFPSPLDYDDMEEDERKKAVMELARQKMNAAFPPEYKAEVKTPDKVIEFGAIRDFSDDELNMILGRRRQGISYPESAKDIGEFEFYESNGFIESGDSRLLYKQVE